MESGLETGPEPAEPAERSSERFKRKRSQPRGAPWTPEEDAALLRHAG